jgi:hypothetical protein
MARVTVRFPGVPDGEVHPRWFEIGDSVVGDLASVAIAEGWAVPEPTIDATLSQIDWRELVVRKFHQIIASVSAFIRKLRGDPTN